MCQKWGGAEQFGRDLSKCAWNHPANFGDAKSAILICSRPSPAIPNLMRARNIYGLTKAMLTHTQVATSKPQRGINIYINVVNTFMLHAIMTAA